MDKMSSSESTVPEIIDEYVNYKFIRYVDKLDRYFKKIRGEVYCDSEIINQDVLEP
jgi:hypothetical protein